jgi:hypothetical protein
MHMENHLACFGYAVVYERVFVGRIGDVLSKRKTIQTFYRCYSYIGIASDCYGIIIEIIIVMVCIDCQIIYTIVIISAVDNFFVCFMLMYSIKLYLCKKIVKIFLSE